MFDNEREPYHHMETSIRITTAAVINSSEGELLTDLLRVTEDVGGSFRHATNHLQLWLGDQDDPASVVMVCDRLIATLTEIRERNFDGTAALTPDPGDHYVRAGTPAVLEPDRLAV